MGNRRRHVLIEDARLRTLCLAVAVMNIGYTIIIPVVPAYADQYHIATATLGLLFTVFAFGRATSQVAGGILVSRFGDRAVASAAVGLIALPTLCLAFFVRPPAMLASRLAWGVLEGVAVPALYSLVSRLADARRQGEALGAFGACAVAGMALGPVVGGYALLLGGVALPFLVAAAVHLLSGALLLTSARSPEGQPRAAIPPREPASRLEGGKRAGAWLLALSGLGAAGALGCVDLANNLAYGMVEPVLPLQLAGQGFGTQHISLVFTLGLAVFTVGSLALGRLCDRGHPIRLMTGALLLGALAVAALGFRLTLTAAFLIFGGFMITQCLVYILTRKLLRDAYLDERDRARAFGFFGTLSDGGFILGPALGGMAFGSMGRAAFWVFAAGMLPFVVAVGAVARLRPGSPQPG